MSHVPRNHRSHAGAAPSAELARVDGRPQISRLKQSKPMVTTLALPDGLAIRVSGELDIAGAARFERELMSAIASSRLVLLDLRETSFIDAAALGVIVRGDLHTRESGGRLIVVPGSLAVRRLLSVSGMYRRLEIVDDRTARPPLGG